jgi:hypothetical protein
MSEELEMLKEFGELDRDKRDANVTITDTEIKSLEELRSASSEIEILEAVSNLSGTSQTPESMAVISAAGTMIANQIEEGED